MIKEVLKYFGHVTPMSRSLFGPVDSFYGPQSTVAMIICDSQLIFHAHLVVADRGKM